MINCWKYFFDQFKNKDGAKRLSYGCVNLIMYFAVLPALQSLVWSMVWILYSTSHLDWVHCALLLYDSSYLKQQNNNKIIVRFKHYNHIYVWDSMVAYKHLDHIYYILAVEHNLCCWLMHTKHSLKQFWFHWKKGYDKVHPHFINRKKETR